MAQEAAARQQAGRARLVSVRALFIVRRGDKPSEVVSSVLPNTEVQRLNFEMKLGMRIGLIPGASLREGAQLETNCRRTS
jgi:hypothetical protein